MKKIALIMENGLISFIVDYEFEEDATYQDGNHYNDLLAKDISEMQANNLDILATIHWTGSEFGIHEPALPNQVWDKTSFSFKTDQHAIDIMLDYQAKEKRNRLLLNSDWTELPSALSRLGETKVTVWQTYRQALRDIPKQEGYPFNVIWPTQPV